MPSKLLPITEEEKRWVKQFKNHRAWLYHFSRGCIRHVISNMTGIDPLQIPLKADPGQPPLLPEGWGYISLSHCSDALLIGWSSRKIGVDIERKDRQFKAMKLSKRFFHQAENLEIEHLTDKEIQKKVITRWVTKEAAIKWQGGKIATNLSQWIWENNSSFAYNEKFGFKIRVFNKEYHEWIFAIALDKDLEISIPILCRT